MADLTELYGGLFTAAVAARVGSSADAVTAFLAAMESVGVQTLEPIGHRPLCGFASELT